MQLNDEGEEVPTGMTRLDINKLFEVFSTVDEEFARYRERVLYIIAEYRLCPYFHSFVCRALPSIILHASPRSRYFRDQ